MRRTCKMGTVLKCTRACISRQSPFCTSSKYTTKNAANYVAAFLVVYYLFQKLIELVVFFVELLGLGLVAPCLLLKVFIYGIHAERFPILHQYATHNLSSLIYETGSLVTCCYILITFYISDTTCSILTPVFKKIMIFFS